MLHSHCKLMQCCGVGMQAAKVLPSYACVATAYASACAAPACSHTVARDVKAPTAALLQPALFIFDGSLQSNAACSSRSGSATRGDVTSLRTSTAFGDSSPGRQRCYCCSRPPRRRPQLGSSARPKAKWNQWAGAAATQLAVFGSGLFTRLSALWLSRVEHAQDLEDTLSPVTPQSCAAGV